MHAPVEAHNDSGFHESDCHDDSGCESKPPMDDAKAEKVFTDPQFHKSSSHGEKRKHSNDESNLQGDAKDDERPPVAKVAHVATQTDGVSVEQVDECITSSTPVATIKQLQCPMAPKRAVTTKSVYANVAELEPAEMRRNAIDKQFLEAVADTARAHIDTIALEQCDGCNRPGTADSRLSKAVITSYFHSRWSASKSKAAYVHVARQV